MFDVLEIDDGNCPPFSLVLPAEKSGYHEWLIGLKQCTDVAVFALDFLGGKGTLIDVGSNIGVISTPVAAAGSNVVSLEMIPEFSLYHSLTILRNNLANVRQFQVAASDARGMAGYLAAEGNGYIRPAGDGPPVVNLPLDDVVGLVRLQDPGFITPPVLVKIDTEGHELFVMKGAERRTAYRRGRAGDILRKHHDRRP